jgi:lysophospholipase L1-like esterase
MRKTIILLACSLFQLLGYAQQIRPNRYEIMPTKEEGSIIFVGNSITDDCEWGELFGNPNILSRGIDGNSSADVLRRTPELIRHKPSKVFFEIGTNDIAGKVPTDTIIRNMSKILQLFANGSPKTKLYIQSVLPVGPNPMFIQSGHNNEGIVALNEQFKLFCKKNNITYIDLHSHFLGDDGINLNPKLTNDDLHIMGAGYLLWKSIVNKYVNE